MTVDFHVHSSCSDGTFSPRELIEQSGFLSALALTDHDNCDGVREFFEVESPTDVFRVSGLELSVEPGENFDKFHLLGLGVDAENVQLKKFLESIVKERNDRNEKIIENFYRIGIPINPSPGIGVLARPHFARWLVQNSYASSITEAFEKYLLSTSPKETRCYVERKRPLQEDAISVIKAAGGLAIMAHPVYWKKNWSKEGCDYAAAEKALWDLKEKGLDGIESIYGANTQEQNVAFTMIAQKLGFLKSAGSDFHGLNKPNVKLGIEVTDAFITPLIERLKNGTKNK